MPKRKSNIKIISTRKKEDIENFFSSGEISISLPEARYCAKKVLQARPNKCYEVYINLENSRKKLALSSFVKLRLKKIHMMDKNSKLQMIW